MDTPRLLALVDPVVEEIMTAFDIEAPPISVELMLQHPRHNLWPEVDITEMSATFLSLSDRYAPRMSLVRLLARHVARSPWGQSRNLNPILQDADTINVFARALIMPRRFLEALAEDIRANSMAVSLRFEVPQADVQARFHDLGILEH